MNLDFLKKNKPTYISVNDDGFDIKGRKHREIKCFIKAMFPVRKLFKGRSIECYSNDAEKGKNGQFCSLCPKRISCRQRIRLMLLVVEDEQNKTPAQLEINNHSFESLEKLIEPLKEDELPEMLLALQVTKQGKYLQVVFSSVF